MTVQDTVIQADALLKELKVRHAFGGALALAHYTSPRYTMDVDINVFVPFTAAPELVGKFAAPGFLPVEPDHATWLPTAGVRLRRTDDPVPVDLFFSIDDEYEEIYERRRSFVFGDLRRKISFLSPEDLAIFKMHFNRDKDWVDLRQLAEQSDGLDLDYVARKAVALRGPSMYPRVTRLRTLVSSSDR